MRALLIATLLAGCASEPATRDPLDYLRVGADFTAEADRFAANLRARGWSVAGRLDGRTYAALTARDDERSLIRIWSRRGLVVSIDAPSAEHWRRDLVLAPPVEALDLDGDGLEELVLGATDDAMDRTCYALVRIGPEGFAREATPIYEELGGDGCVEGFTTEPELRAIVVVRFPDLARGSVPRVAVPHGAEEGAWVPALAAPFLESERRARARQLAAGELSPARAAVELAAIAHLGGEDTAAQLSVYDEAMGGTAASEARTWIANGWRAEPPDAR